MADKTPKTKKLFYASRYASIPRIYGDTPSFLGCKIINLPEGAKGCDVVFIGVPWEGPVTWPSFSGCELATKTIRHASSRYGFYTSDYDLCIDDYLILGDAGDVRVTPGKSEETMEEIKSVTGHIIRRGAVPVGFGGDHSWPPAVVASLAEETNGEVGIIHLDAHVDNVTESYGGDPFTRCSPLHRIQQIPNVRLESIVHMGIHGPRAESDQMKNTREKGCTVITMAEIRKRGIDMVVDQALEVAHKGTKSVYMSICSDVLDHSSNPGGPPDFGGLMPAELFYMVNRITKEGINGIDMVEIFPLSDPNGASSHLVVQTLFHALAGMVQRKK